MNGMLRARKIVTAIAVSTALSAPAFAGFPTTEAFLPAVGRVSGNGGSEFYTTVWVSNLGSSSVTFRFEFLKQGQTNTSPLSFTDALPAGQTRMYENVVEEKLGLSNAIGAARITSSGEILASERIYDQPAGADLGDTEGLFFAAVPRSFSIGLGQSATVQGVNQGGSEDFRYNFALVETGGGSPTVHVRLLDASGTQLGAKDYVLQPYEQIQPNVADLDSSVSTTNAILTATVTGGTGSVLIAGAQLANQTQDSSGFEMSFRDDLLGASSASGVTSLNGLTGAVVLSAGYNVTITPSGNMLTISANGPWLSSVTTDSTLTGNGTSGSPLGLSVPLVVAVQDTSAPIAASSQGGDGLFGFSGSGNGVDGRSDHGPGVKGESAGPYGGYFQNVGTGVGVGGFSTSGNAVVGQADSGDGVYGQTAGAGRAGVSGHNTGGGDGVYGQSSGNAGYFSGNLTVTGNSKIMGTKSFIEPHPTDPSKEIRFVSLEGPESGTYFRGRGHIVAGVATIEVPEAFRLVTDEKGLTVELTPIGDFASLAVARIGLDRITVIGNRDIEFSYLVQGSRRGFDVSAIEPNTDFVPPGGSAGSWKHLAPQVRALLIGNGTLNPDGTINEATAHRLGWDKRPGWNENP